jgi:hypothetical protein
METILRLTRILFIPFLILLIGACENKADYKSFLVKVDSVQVPTAITSNTPFEIKFYGTISTNGCSSFTNFDVKEESNNIVIEAWAKADLNAFACPTVIVYLTGHNMTYTIPNKGIYNLKIKQPDNSYLEKQIMIN